MFKQQKKKVKTVLGIGLENIKIKPSTYMDNKYIMNRKKKNSLF